MNFKNNISFGSSLAQLLPIVNLTVDFIQFSSRLEFCDSSPNCTFCEFGQKTNNKS